MFGADHIGISCLAQPGLEYGLGFNQTLHAILGHLNVGFSLRRPFRSLVMLVEANSKPQLQTIQSRLGTVETESSGSNQGQFFH